MGVYNVARWKQQRRKQWYEHVRKMNKSNFVRIALKCTPKSRRPLEKLQNSKIAGTQYHQRNNKPSWFQ